MMNIDIYDEILFQNNINLLNMIIKKYKIYDFENTEFYISEIKYKHDENKIYFMVDEGN